ncbi:MAG: energy-coupling factor transporter transmembrane component T family protein [Candidatus Methanofastidiosia archaeon]
MIKYSMYLPHSSFLHRLDPRVKFMLSLCIFLIAIAFTHAHILALLFGTIFLILKIGGKVPIKTFFIYLKPILPLVVLMILMWPFFRRSGDVLLEFWKIKITDEGILMGIAMAFRILTMISATFLLLMTTQQKDIILALTQMKLPYEYGLTLAISLRYVPTLAGMAQTIMDAQRSRGLELDKGNFIEKIKKYIPILTPLIVGAIHMAQELAIAIDSRGFGHGKRTYLSKLKMRTIDFVVFITIASVFVLLLYIRIELF